MDLPGKRNKGLKKLIRRCRKIFRTPENLEHYAPEDFRQAERNFIKAVCTEGKIPDALIAEEPQEDSQPGEHKSA